MTKSAKKHPGVWTTYDNSNGLQTGVICLAQDAMGFLRLGTFGGGLVRFDGVQFSHYTTENGLTNNHVRDVFPDQNDHLWIRMWAGGSEVYVDRYDKDRFIAYKEDTLFAQFHREPGGPLWAIDDFGIIYRYDSQAFVPHDTQQTQFPYEFDKIIGGSAAMQQVYSLKEKAIDAGLTVLLSGDTG